MNRRNLAVALLTGAFAVPGCGPSDDAADQPENPPADMPAMQGMPGMDMGAGGGMMGRMAEHMEMMEGMSADSVHATLQTHRQMVANMIAQMNREMSDMDMEGDAAWDATIDSLRADLTRMRELTPAELDQIMPAHRARVRRLMQMHEEMMAGMGS